MQNPLGVEAAGRLQEVAAGKLEVRLSLTYIAQIYERIHVK